jgi:hypothetical protein
MTQLMFVLEIDDGWPPVAKECMTCSDCESGYRIEVPPLFIKDLSVGDVISIERNDEGEVSAWSHVEKSMRSTIWIMVSGGHSINDGLDCLKKLKCNVEEFEPYNYFAIDVPAECQVEQLDACLNALSGENVSVAFPSFRH